MPKTIWVALGGAARSWRRALVVGVSLWALVDLLVGCGGAESRREPPPALLETVDVAPARDASASLAAEPVEVRREDPGGFSGVLPAGFPADVPILLPSSLVDVILRGDGGVEIVLASAATPAEVAQAYARLLAAAGWKGGRSGAGGRWSKGPRSLEVEVTDSRPGSRLRIAVAAR